MTTIYEAIFKNVFIKPSNTTLNISKATCGVYKLFNKGNVDRAINESRMLKVPVYIPRIPDTLQHYSQCYSNRISHCQKALKALHSNSIFEPVCNCDDFKLHRRYVNKEDEWEPNQYSINDYKVYQDSCLDFRNFIYNHPCLYMKSKRISHDRLLSAKDLSCTVAYEACFQKASCKSLFFDYQYNCRMLDSAICEMESSQDCWYSWLEIKSTTLYNCTCIGNLDIACDKINKLLHANPCIKRLQNIMNFNKSSLLNSIMVHSANLSHPISLFSPISFDDILTSYFMNTDFIPGNYSTLSNATFLLRKAFRNQHNMFSQNVSDSVLIDKLRRQEDIIWISYMIALYLKNLTINFKWPTTEFKASNISTSFLSSDSRLLKANTLIPNYTLPSYPDMNDTIYYVNDNLSSYNGTNVIDSLGEFSLEYPYSGFNNDSKIRIKHATTTRNANLINSTHISLFEKLINLTLSTRSYLNEIYGNDTINVCSSSALGKNKFDVSCMMHNYSYRNPVYFHTTPIPDEDIKCSSVFLKCNTDSKCVTAMSDIISACAYSKNLENLKEDVENYENKVPAILRRALNEKQDITRKNRNTSDKIQDRNILNKPSVGNEAGKIIRKKLKNKDPITTEKITDGKIESVTKIKLSTKKRPLSALQCDKVVCMGAIRNFYQQIDPYFTHPLVFCTCESNDVKCLRIREAIYPPCVSDNIKNKADSDMKDADSEKSGESNEFGLPSCLEVKRLCEFDFFCKDNFANYRQYCKMSSTDGKCKEDSSKCREARVGLMGTELMVKNCTCDLPSINLDESIKSSCLDIYQIIFENTCLEEAALDYVKNPVQTTSTTIKITTTTVSSTANVGVNVSDIKNVPSLSDVSTKMTTIFDIKETTTAKAISDIVINEPLKKEIDCSQMHSECIADTECKTKLNEMLSECSTIGSCDPKICKEKTATFYHQIDPYFTYAMAFCHCSPKDTACNTFKEELDFKCGFITSIKITCTQMYESCANSSACKKLLAELEVGCKVNPDKGQCMQDERLCQKTLIKIKGSDLMLRKCSCEEYTGTAKIRCMDYFSVMVNNSCIDHTVKSYHLNPIKTTKTFPLVFQSQTTPFTTKLTQVTQEMIPHNCSLKIHPDSETIYIPVDAKVRVYAQKRDCSKLCHCERENYIQCIIIPCLPATPCIRKFAIYGHGAPTYVAFRGYCLCFMGKILCVKPDPDKFAFQQNDTGLFISVGFSSQEFSLLERVTHDNYDDLIPRLQKNLVTGSGNHYNNTRCHLEIFQKFTDNVVIEAKLAMQINSKGLRYRDKDCLKSIERLSEQINNQDLILMKDPLLSVLKLSEVFMRLPEDDISLAHTTSCASVSFFLRQTSCIG
ncbi:uncharacterized protein LOC135927033 [Gordionus sp. m RMFG-2023]|uniref:uncharacterized protein LOC135927033 n=1 Tax=Gordionus sp. m RMFG-2023 TaxID=3053472 RepID=UPI0031FCD5C1